MLNVWAVTTVELAGSEKHAQENCVFPDLLQWLLPGGCVLPLYPCEWSAGCCWCAFAALLSVKAGCCTGVLGLMCLSIMAESDWWVDSDCDFSFSALQWGAQAIHCKPASSSCHSSGWCSSSISELAEKSDDQMQPVKKTKHMLYRNICSVCLSWRWNFTVSRQNSLTGETVAFWEA